MALVRLNNDNRGEIRWALKQIYDKKIQSAKNTFKPDWGPRIYKAVMDPHLDAVNLLPKGFFNVASRLDLRVTKQGTPSGYLDIQMPLTKNGLGVPWPHESPVKVWPDIFASSSYYIALRDHPSVHDIYVEIQDYADRVVTVHKEAQAAETSLAQLLDSHKDLASALKEWGALWELLPQHMKDKHNETAASKQVPPSPPAPDLSGLANLTAELAKNRIVGKETK